MSTPAFNREAVEAALPSEVRAALPALLSAWGVRIRERWPHHPALRDTLALTAARALVLRYEAEGVKETAAVKLACYDLGLAYEAVERRLRRWRDTYWAACLEPAEKRTKCPRHGAEAVAGSG